VPKRKWSDQQLRDLVASSKTWVAVLRGLGLSPRGRNHYSVTRRAAELTLDTSHFASVARRKSDEALRSAVQGSTHLDAVLEQLELGSIKATREWVLSRAREIGLDTLHLERPIIERQRRSRRRWTDEQLRAAAAASTSYAGVIRALGLIAAGGNYDHVRRRIRELAIDIAHFTGMGWNVGLRFDPRPHVPLEAVLVAGRWTGSHGLKKRLFLAKLKSPQCELCGWAERAADGRLPVELDHKNGDKNDNRLENLRILCPNCHSLQSTHRGRNKESVRRRGC